MNSFYQIRALDAAEQADDGGAPVIDGAPVEILIYGLIGEAVFDAGIEAARFVSDLERIDAERIRVRINSQGGSVPDGISIYNALRQHSAAIEVQIDGWALSVASMIAMVGDTITMPSNTLLMIHAPAAMASGNAGQLREQAEMLDQWAEAMKTAYIRVAGREHADRITGLLTDGKDHWFTAEQASDAGLVTDVSDETPITAAYDHGLSHISKIPAAAAVVLQQQQASAMSESNNTDQRVDAFKKQEAQRRADIRALCAPYANYDGVRALERRIIDDMDLSVDAARKQLLDQIGKGVEPLAGPGVEFNARGDDGFKAAAADGLLLDNGINVKEPHAAARDFRGLSVKDIASACLSRAGKRADDFGPDSVIASAQTTSDFPDLLANIAQKALIQGLDATEIASHRNTWTRETSLQDFKSASRIALGDSPDLEKVPEGSEYQHGNVLDNGAESIQLETFGRVVQISRQALVNDDLSALTRLPMSMGMAAARTETDQVYTLLANNPTMRDGKDLFSTAHGNLAATESKLRVESLGAARAALRKQRGVGNSSFLNVVPKYLIVGADREVEAQQLMTDLAPNQPSNAVPGWIANLTLVVDPRVDTLCAGAWFLAGDPLVHDTVEVAHLGGNNMPQLKQQEHFETAAMAWRVTFDVGTAALDWRALYMNPGA